MSLQSMNSGVKTIVGLGETLWDLFPDFRRPGGAPCNAAYHAAQLRNRGVIVSRVGADALGQDMRTFLEDRGLDTSFLQVDGEFATGTVGVTFENGEPSYAIAERVAWDRIAFSDELAELAASCGAVCYESLSQRSETTRSTVLRFLQHVRPQAFCIFDVNLRPPFVDRDVLHESIVMADVVKMNREERSTISSMFGRRDVERWMQDQMNVQLVCVTLGADGCELFEGDRRFSRRAEPVDTSEGDSVGVGDAFVAALAHGLVRQWRRDECLGFANRYAALVATRKGGMPELSEEDLAPFRR
jgi:fructokinase